MNRRHLFALLAAALAATALPRSPLEAQRLPAWPLPAPVRGSRIAELFVSVGADVSGAVAGLTAVGMELTRTGHLYKLPLTPDDRAALEELVRIANGNYYNAWTL